MYEHEDFVLKVKLVATSDKLEIGNIEELNERLNSMMNKWGKLPSVMDEPLVAHFGLERLMNESQELRKPIGDTKPNQL